MEGTQKISCTVESCKYNNENGLCTLTEIVVTPTENRTTKQPDESRCSSYEYNS